MAPAIESDKPLERKRWARGEPEAETSANNREEFRTATPSTVRDPRLESGKGGGRTSIDDSKVNSLIDLCQENRTCDLWTFFGDFVAYSLNYLAYYPFSILKCTFQLLRRFHSEKKPK